MMNRSFQDRKTALHRLMQDTRALAAESGFGEIADRLGEISRQLLEGRLFLVVCGELKQGKSSLLGAFLEDPELFPVDADVATSRITMARHSRKEKLTAWVGSPGSAEPRILRRDQIARHVTERGNPDNALDVRLLQIETPNPRLADGLVMVDTPGVSGVDASHIEVTLGLLPRADLVLFVSDALAPLTQPELDFLRDHVAEAATEIVFVVTKIDQTLAVDSILESNRHKLSEVLGSRAGDVTSLGVSSRSKLRFLESGDPEDFEDSGFRELEVELERRLQGRRGLILLRQAFARFAQELEQLRRPLATELAACRREDRRGGESLESELETIRQRVQELGSEGARWRGELLRGVQRLRQRILGGEYPLEASRLQQLLDAELGEDHNLEDPQALLGRIEAELARTFARLARSVDRKVQELTHRVAEETRIAWDAGPFVAAAPGGVSLDSAQLGSKSDAVRMPALDVARRAAGGMIGGSVLGGSPLTLALTLGVGATKILGATVAPWVFPLLTALWFTSGTGSLFGCWTGVRKGLAAFKNRQRQTARQELRNHITPILKEILIQFKANLDEALTNLQEALVDSFTEQLKQEKQTLERSVASLREARQLNAEEAAERARRLEKRLTWLESKKREGLRLMAPATAKLRPANEAPVTHRDLVRAAAGPQAHD